MEEDKILRQNKIPGCDELTKPEEIKALSKFLRKVKEVQSEHTTLQKDNLEVPGRTTGKIPKINKLPNSREELKDSRKVNLSDKSISIPKNKKEETRLSDYKEDLVVEKNNELSNTKETLNDDRKVVLDDYKDELTDNRINKLSDTRENLEDDREVSLGNKREGLKDTRETELTNYKEKLDDNRTTKLNDYQEKLYTNKSLEKLPNYKDKIDTPNTNKLSDYKEELEVDKENRLTNYKETLEDNRSNSLSNYRENLEDDREVSLGNKREDLKDTRTTELSNYQEKLDIGETLDELPTFKENIDGVKEQQLSDYKEELEVNKEQKLGDYKEELKVDNKVEELPDYKETIQNTKEVELSDYLEELEKPDELNELPDYKEKIEVEKEIDLSNYQEGLDLNSGDHSGEVEDLPDYKETIKDDRENQLSDHKEELDLESGGNSGQIEELSDYKENIKDDREIELSNYKETIEDDREANLSDYKEKLEVSGENKLSDYKEELNVEDNPELSEYQEKLDVAGSESSGIIENLNDYQEKIDLESGNNSGEITSLPDTFLTLTDDRENKLSEHKESITDDREISLEDNIEDLVDDRDNKLSDHIESLNDDREDIQLEDYKEEITDDRELELGDFIDDLEDDRENQLEDHQEKLEGETKDPELYTEKDRIEQPIADNEETYFNPAVEGNELYDAVLERPDANNKETYFDPTVEGSELYDAVLETPETQTAKSRKLKDELTKRDDKATDLREVLAALKGNNEQDFYNNLMTLLGNSGEWGQKIQSLMSAYLSSSAISMERANEYEARLGQEFLELQEIKNKLPQIEDGKEVELSNKIVYTPRYKLPEFKLLGGNSLNLNQYIRWAAEETIGAFTNLHGSARELLMNETIALLLVARDTLEDLSDARRDRLPGGEMSSALSDLVSGGVEKAATNMIKRSLSAMSSTKGYDKSNPINRPDKKPVTGWQSANSRGSNKIEDKGFWNKVGDTLVSMGEAALGLNSSAEKDYNFLTNYLSTDGIQLTLSELCLSKTVDSVDGLFDAIRSSPFMTVPEKFTTTGNNGYVATTLDSNAYWEIIFEPYVGVENGGFSYLPAISEINARNRYIHGVETGYNRWIPFQSFDLQKARMHTKNINLYDGEITYPVSMEFINELRLTIIDDQYKSWRTYFETCADAMIYNSEPHVKSYYENNYGTHLTAIDKSSVCVSMYKNVCFRCIIYIMTPQLSTIKKYDLLLTLKDFSEENNGDSIEAGAANDLSLTFSIVGENPVTEVDRSQVLNIEKIEKVDPNAGNLSSIISSGVDSVIGLLS